MLKHVLLPRILAHGEPTLEQVLLTEIVALESLYCSIFSWQELWPWTSPCWTWLSWQELWVWRAHIGAVYPVRNSGPGEPMLEHMFLTGTVIPESPHRSKWSWQESDPHWSRFTWQELGPWRGHTGAGSPEKNRDPWRRTAVHGEDSHWSQGKMWEWRRCREGLFYTHSNPASPIPFAALGLGWEM